MSRSKGICSYHSYNSSVVFYMQKQYSSEKLYTGLRDDIKIPARSKDWKQLKEVAQNNDEIDTIGWELIHNDPEKRNNILIEIETKNWLETFK